MNKDKILRTIVFVISLIVLFTSLYIITNYTSEQLQEQFYGFKLDKNTCPNLLIKKDNHIYLYDSNRIITPGVNPVIFNSLYEYTEYQEYERSKGRRCPVLELHHVYDPQGKSVYKVYPSPSDKNSSLSQKQPHMEIERNLIDANYNTGDYPGYDDSGFDVGVYTPLDKMFHSKDRISDNAMDTNWGGPEYSRNIVDAGKYNNGTKIEYRREKKHNVQQNNHSITEGSRSKALESEKKQYIMAGKNNK